MLCGLHLPLPAAATCVPRATALSTTSPTCCLTSEAEQARLPEARLASKADLQPWQPRLAGLHWEEQPENPSNSYSAASHSERVQRPAERLQRKSGLRELNRELMSWPDKGQAAPSRESPKPHPNSKSP